ncbi:hypothetical protein PRIPAC_71792 [Pristionchus pacificus]|uniref:Uncharacterized protein n=1 Tax=Pristionchus pacificus TaxID=54126 RepID=A0A454XRI3_PRIPA|nr:hypothetical protein PRIPAC_71792 [Pristionchus pacificus]|eukprot:PDM83651.1 hypothetical protein PRIPAC_30138 [Pristionchus pacificus]
MTRIARAAAYWAALPRRMLQEYPEQTIFWSTFGTAAFALLAYRISYATAEGPRPWYRGYYSVVRPDDPIAINWRKPEEYPAPYLSTKMPGAKI